MSRPKDPAEYMASLFDDENRRDPTAEGTTTGTDPPETSHMAAARVWPKTGTQRAKILKFLYDLWPGAATDERMQDMLGVHGSSQRPRRGELVTLGWVKDTGHTEPTHGGDPAILWQYVPAKGEKI